MNKSSFVVLFSILFIFSLSSCRTLGGVQKETAPLDYSNDDVIRNEIKRINELKQVEPVEAYWRSILLGEENVKNECISYLEESGKKAFEEKDYITAWRFINSLEVTGKKLSDIDSEKIEKLIKEDVPGFMENDKEPSSVSECIKATVTILVDKGIKITNGSGVPDRVLGSGFFIDKRGYIVTNHHVIEDMVNPSYEGYSRLYIKLSGEENDKIPAKVIGYDSLSDLALLKTEIIPEFVFSLGSSEELVSGDKINVIGAPLGLESSISEGIVSNTRRKLIPTGDVFQIDAPVNSGNSGGPCIDKSMRVQAVVFAGVLQAQGLNFAIPVEYLKQELPFLYAGGEFNHSWTGCYGHTKKSGSKKTGVDVQYVMPGSSARLAGFRGGEVIQNVNGIPVESLEKLQGMFRERGPGTIVNVEYLDESGEERNSYVYLSKRAESPALEMYESDLIENSFLPLYGMQLVPSSTTSKNYFKITRVLESSDAEELQFSENDPITIRKVRIFKEDKYIIAQIVTRRQKKNLIDVGMVLGTAFDGPNFF